MRAVCASATRSGEPVWGHCCGQNHRFARVRSVNGPQSVDSSVGMQGGAVRALATFWQGRSLLSSAAWRTPRRARRRSRRLPVEVDVVGGPEGPLGFGHGALAEDSSWWPERIPSLRRYRPESSPKHTLTMFDIHPSNRGGVAETNVRTPMSMLPKDSCKAAQRSVSILCGPRPGSTPPFRPPFARPLPSLVAEKQGSLGASWAPTARNSGGRCTDVENQEAVCRGLWGTLLRLGPERSAPRARLPGSNAVPARWPVPPPPAPARRPRLGRG